MQCLSQMNRTKALNGSLVDLHKQFRLEYVLALFVFLRRFVSLIVLPTNRALALPARDVAHNVSAGCHASLVGVALDDVDDFLEEECFAVLAAEVLV